MTLMVPSAALATAFAVPAHRLVVRVSAFTADPRMAVVVSAGVSPAAWTFVPGRLVFLDGLASTDPAGYIIPRARTNIWICLAGSTVKDRRKHIDAVHGALYKIPRCPATRVLWHSVHMRPITSKTLK